MGYKRRHSYTSDSSGSSSNREELANELIKFLKKNKRRDGRSYRRRSRSRSTRRSRGRSLRRSRGRSSRRRSRSRCSTCSESRSSSADSRRIGSVPKSDDRAKADVPDKTVSVEKTTPEEPAVSRTEVLKKLGKNVLDEKKVSSAVNDLITCRWTGIVKKGLPEKESAEIVALYPTPENNLLWDPPKLNPEVKSSLHESAVLRDSRIVAKQVKISACLAAAAQMIEELMKQEPSDFNNSFLDRLGDLGSLLSDLQHDDSRVRKNLVVAGTPNASAKKILAETETGEFLCGDKLDDALKSGKALAATAEELRLQTQAQGSPKQPKNLKGPSRGPNNYNVASMGGQRNYQQSQYNGHSPQRSYSHQRESPQRSSKRDQPEKDQQRRSQRHKK